MLPPAYQPTKNLIESSKKILTQYDHACRFLASSEKFLGTEATEDSDSWKLSNLLDQRRKDVKCQVNNTLGVNVSAGKGGTVRDTSHGKDGDIWSRYAKAEENGKQLNVYALNGDGWVEATKHAVRDIQRVVKHLPEDI